jgi:hypothetical protein
MPHGGVHQSGGKDLAIVQGDNVKILRRARRLVPVAGCAALALGLASSAVAKGPSGRGALTTTASSATPPRAQRKLGRWRRSAWPAGSPHIAAGVNHVLALRPDGTVLAWGNDSAGETGAGTASDSPALPAEVTGLTNVTQVAGAMA